MKLPRVVAYFALAASWFAAGQPTSTAVSANDQVDEEVIVVTALRRETALLETPLSISAFEGADLESTGADGLEAFLQFAPGVSFDRSNSGDQRVFIRGLASTYGNSPIGFYLDEVPFTALTVTFTPDVRSFDLDRVEVLRGPQGTLYGASSLGGTIRVLTNDPVHNEFQAKGDMSYADTEDGDTSYGVKTAVNLPLVDDRLSLRLVATQEDEGGWIDLENPQRGFSKDDQNHFEVWTGRAKLLYTISDTADAKLSYWHTDSSADNRNFADDSGSVSTLFSATFATDVESDLYSGELSWDVGAATLTSATSYFDYKNDIYFIDFPNSFSKQSIEIFSQELRLTSLVDGPLFWTLGGIYIDNQTFIDFFFNLPGFFVNASTQDNESESYAVYGEATYSLTDEIDATLGLRYYDDDVTRNDTQFGVSQPEVENNYNDWSPRFNLAWMPNDDTMLFGTISKGFRTGLTQPSISLAAADFVGIGIEDSIESEDAWNYEIGSKLALLDGRVTIDAVLYYIDWTDLQTQVLLDPVVIAFINAGDAEAYGFEFATTYRVGDDLSFALSGNVNDSTYSETVTDTFGRVVFDEGTQIQFVPEYTFTGSMDYGRDLGGEWRGVVHASFEYAGARSTTNNALTEVHGEANLRVNLRVGGQTDTLGVFLFAENVTNDDSRIDPAGTALAAAYASRYRPRTIGLNLRLDL